MTYATAPTDPVANANYRIELIDRCQDAGFRSAVIERCQTDFQFWGDSFAWTLDPRFPNDPTPAVRPFVMYPYQRERIIAPMNDAIQGGKSVAFPKSRDMGVTVSLTALAYHQACFIKEAHVLFGSRTEELVDRPRDPSTLFAKLDLLWRMSPEWLRPSINRNHMMMHFALSNSTISGAAAANLGRGGRTRWILCDEAAQMARGVRGSVFQNARTVAWVSTPFGAGNEFADIVTEGKVKVSPLHWPLHPLKSVGLYHVPAPPNYRGVRYGDAHELQARSPWYDGVCDELGSPSLIAQEVDIDFVQSGSMYFDLGVLIGLEDGCCSPKWQGELRYKVSVKTGRIEVERFAPEDGRKSLSVWAEPVHGHYYLIGGDIATGSGASNTVLDVLDCTTREQVALLASPFLSPEDAGRYGVALAQWYNNARLQWEDTGPGEQFCREARRAGYGNLYRQRDPDTFKMGSRYGWQSTRTAKAALLGDLKRALARHAFTVNDATFIKEAKLYQWQESGGIGPEGTIDDDPSGAGANHGDRVIAKALLTLDLPDNYDLPFAEGDEARYARERLREIGSDRKMTRARMEHV